ncbi:hypothetical protein D3C72_2449020 [compost metagenome]
MRLVEKNPEDRYQSAIGLEADLSRLAAALDEGADLDALTLDGHAVPLRFSLAEKLYGREAEIA